MDNINQLKVTFTRLDQDLVEELERQITERLDDDWDSDVLQRFQYLVMSHDVAWDHIEQIDAEVGKYHKLHDDGYNEMRIMQEDKRKLQNVYDEQYERACILQGENDRLVLEVKSQVRRNDEQRALNNGLLAEHAAMKAVLEVYAITGLEGARTVLSTIKCTP